MELLEAETVLVPVADRVPEPQGLLLRVPVPELQKEARSELLLLPLPEEEREPVPVTDREAALLELVLTDTEVEGEMLLLTEAVPLPEGD